MPEKNKTVEEKVQEFLDSFDEKMKAERAENEKLTDSKIDAMKADMKKEMDDIVKSFRQNNVNVPGSNEEKQEFDFAKAAFGIINKEWAGAGFEKEVMDAARKKAIDTNTGGQGGFLIPIEIAQEQIIKPAIANTVLKDLGVTMWTGLTADLDIPEATSRPSLVWGADGQAQQAQDINFALKKLRPKEGGMLCKVSNKLLMQATVANQIVKDLMMEGVTVGIDNIGINGKGDDSEPLGILNVTGTNTKDISSARMKIDDVAAMIADIEEDDFLKMGGAGVLTRPIVKSGLKREQVAMFSGDTGGMPILNPWMSDRALEDTLGVKIRTTTNVGFTSGTLTRAVVGEFKEFVMGIWGGMRLKSSDQAGTAFASNQTWLVIFVDVDAICLRPKALSIASNIETNW